MESLLEELLNTLEQIGDTHDEIYDSDVRDAMGDTVFHAFIKPKLDFVIPDNYGMYSSTGNRLIFEAMANFIPKACDLATSLGLVSFHARLAAFQNSSVKTASQYKRNYDDFFGWMNPEDFDDEGRVKQRHDN